MPKSCGALIGKTNGKRSSKISIILFFIILENRIVIYEYRQTCLDLHTNVSYDHPMMDV